MTVHYDALSVNRNMALDLPFREGTGTITHSLAKTHPLVTIVDVGGVWTTLDSYLQVLTLDGVNDYLWASAADTVNLDFTSEDYSVGGWFWFTSGLANDLTLLSRFLVSVDGWELYHYTNQILTLRHHHASQAPTLRTAAYSENWAFNKWWFLGVSRSGGAAQFWRGDINSFGIITTTIAPGGLLDPDSCNRNLHVGRDAAVGSNLYNGMLWRPRSWFDRYITEAEWQQVWEKEVEWFRS